MNDIESLKKKHEIAKDASAADWRGNRSLSDLYPRGPGMRGLEPRPPARVNPLAVKNEPSENIDEYRITLLECSA